MSGLVVGLVLRTPITDKFNSEAKFVATVYADHAWEDGSHAYPAVATVAMITGLSERTVQRYLRILETIGMLKSSGKGPRGTTCYNFPLVENTDGSVRLALHGGDSVTPPAEEQKTADSGVTQSPRQADGGDTVSGDTVSGDSIVSPKQTTRHLKPKEEEEAKTPRKFEIGEQLQEALKELGIFVSTWDAVEKRLAEGWIETDIFALINWMRATTKNKTQAAQRFVTRIRERTKAPKEYYPRYQEVEADLGDGQEDLVSDESKVMQDESVTDRIQSAWNYVKDDLSKEMERGAFAKYVKDTVPVHYEPGYLEVGALSQSQADWLDARVVSIVERLLLGLLNDHTTVNFIVVEAVAVETEEV